MSEIGYEQVEEAVAALQQANSLENEFKLLNSFRELLKIQQHTSYFFNNSSISNL
jgi:hypothetical protein